MDTNEIMVNDGVIETIEDVEITNSGNGFKMAAGISLVVLTGVIVYKYAAKPIMAKIKAMKKTDETNEEVIDADCNEVDESNED